MAAAEKIANDMKCLFGFIAHMVCGLVLFGGAIALGLFGFYKILMFVTDSMTK